MKIAPEKVVDGRGEFDTELPEDTLVTVLAFDGDDCFAANNETGQMLLEATTQCRRCQTTPLTNVLAQMRARE